MAKKVLILSSSPRRGGNSDLLCDRFMAGAQQAGHDVEKIFLRDKKINYCTGCGVCYGGAKPCPQRDEFEYDGETYKRYLPDKVLDFFNYEFDYLELANWQALQNLAMAYFTLIASPYEVTSGGGGGGSQSDLKWGRDPKEDEIEFARRCAQAASKRIGRHSKGGIKRK